MESSPHVCAALALLALCAAPLSSCERPSRLGDGGAATDSGVPDAGPGPGRHGDDGGSIYLEVGTWNLEFFGDPTAGPADDDLQLANVRGVIADAGADFWGVEEVVDDARFQAMVSGLPGRAGIVADDAVVPQGSIFYSATDQKPAFVYDTTKITVLSAQLILTDPTYQYDLAWRPPLRLDLRISKQGAAEDLVVIVLHLKAYATYDDWLRRRNSAEDLKAYLDQNLAAQKVLVLGDWNDDLDVSTAKDGGSYLPSPFLGFLGDPAYAFLTRELAFANVGTTVRYSSTIDHQLATDDLAADWIAGSTEVVRPDLWPVPVAGYGTTTSDHYPVLARFDLLAPDGGS